MVRNHYRGRLHPYNLTKQWEAVTVVELAREENRNQIWERLAEVGREFLCCSL